MTVCFVKSVIPFYWYISRLIFAIEKTILSWRNTKLYSLKFNLNLIHRVKVRHFLLPLTSTVSLSLAHTHTQKYLIHCTLFLFSRNALRILTLSTSVLMVRFHVYCLFFDVKQKIKSNTLLRVQKLNGKISIIFPSIELPEKKKNNK